MPTSIITLSETLTVRAHEVKPSLGLVYNPVSGDWEAPNSTGGKQHSITYLWDANLLAFVVALVPTAGSGSSVTVTNFPATQAVTGTFWQATQPVSAVSLPLPAGAATEATTAGIRTDLGTDGGTPPAVLGAGTGVRGWLRSIYEKLTGTLAVTGAFFQATQPVSGPLTDTQLRATAVPVSGAFFQATQPVSGPLTDTQLRATAVPVSLASLPAVAENRAATLHVTATAAVNVGSTATLPAPAAGLFHYITSVQLTKLYSVVGVAAGAGVIVTSTNLPGTPAWITEQAAGAVGTAPRVIDYEPTTPLRSAVAATATTFVAPAQLQTIWRWNISYFTAP